MTRTRLRLDYDRRGWRRARERITDLARRSQDVRPAWEEFLDWFAHANRQQFGSRGLRWRTPWKELSPAYLAAKRADGWQADILVRTSTLLRSVADRPLAVERLHPQNLRAGTDVEYAMIHHKGAPRANIPRRPLWNTQAVRTSGAATSAVRSWIVHGRPRVSARVVT